MRRRMVDFVHPTHCDLLRNRRCLGRSVYSWSGRWPINVSLISSGMLLYVASNMNTGFVTSVIAMASRAATNALIVCWFLVACARVAPRLDFNVFILRWIALRPLFCLTNRSWCEHHNEPVARSREQPSRRQLRPASKSAGLWRRRDRFRQSVHIVRLLIVP